MIYRSLKNLSIILAFLCSLYIVIRFINQQFQLDNIQAKWNVENASSIDLKDNQDLEQIFRNSFHYLDRGKQAFVFESSDGKYVLKFFDFKCQQSGKVPLIAPISEKRCTKKLKRMIQGFEVALKHDKANTGLIFVQPAPNPLNPFVVNVTDRFGITQQIKLSDVPFALQQKAIPLKKVISKLLKKQDLNLAKTRLKQILNMYIDEYKNGVIDFDHNVMYNTGFIGDKPIRLDVGRLNYDEQVKDPSIYNKDLKNIIERIGEWLSRHYPIYQDEIVKDLKASFN